MINYSSISAVQMSIKNSTFFLAGFKSDSYYRTVSVDFHPLPTANQSSISIMPEFNRDGHFFTKAFVNPYQKFLGIKKTGGDKEAQIQKQRDIFVKKIQGSVSSEAIQSPKFDPEDDHYCSICYEQFKCYWKHVNSRAHRKKIEQSSANQFIHELCSKYQKRTQGSKRSRPQKRNKKRTTDIPFKPKLKSKKSLEKNTMHGFEYRPEDFIIKLPINLFSKEKEQQQNMTINFSTCINSGP